MSIANGIKAINHIFIDLLKVEEGTPKLNTRNAIRRSFCWHWLNQIEYWRNQNRKFKNVNLLKVKRKHSWIQGEKKIQQHFCWRSAKHCYKCAKHKMLQANLWNKIRHKKLHSVAVGSKFLVRALHMNHGGFQYQI